MRSAKWIVVALVLALCASYVSTASAKEPSSYKEEPPEVFEGVGTGALNITEPANGGAFKTAPLYYNGGASLNFTAYDEHVYLTLEELGSVPGEFKVGRGEESVGLRDFAGYWTIESKHLISRRPVYDGEPSSVELPAGTPLEEGKYRVKAVQDCGGTSDPSSKAQLCAEDEDFSENLRARIEFWVDGLAPETFFDSTRATSPTSRAFRFSGVDPQPDPYGEPSGVRKLECSLDGGAWFVCAEGLSVEVHDETLHTIRHKVQFDKEQCEATAVGAEETLPRNCFYEVENLKEGEHTFRVRAVDGAGNVGAPASYSWFVDLTPPNITIDKPVDKAHYVLGQNVPADYSCEDPLSNGFASGIARCEGPVPDGSPIDTSTLGPHEFSVFAEDKAGNMSRKTVYYTVDPPRYPDLVLQSDPIAYYRLGDPIGSATMIDSSGHGHHGEYKNDVALRRPAAPTCERRPHPPRACELTNDPQDWSAYFPARDGYGYANGITAPTQAYTLEAWIKPADGNDMSILGQGGAGQLFISGGHLALRQTQDTVYGGGPTLTPGQWWHVAATWDGHTTRLYVNGQEVGSSTSANKEPSGSATFYVGYGDQAPWFHGEIDEAAYYGTALSHGTLAGHYAVGTTFDHPSLGPGPLDTAGPTVDPSAPSNGGYYAPGKVPNADFVCNDPDGAGDIASCTATVDGTPIADGEPLPDTTGSHVFTVTAVDKGGNEYVHTHTYTVTDFASIFRADHPVAYYRLGDSGETMADSSGNGHDGTYKNDTESGPVGIAGDGDHARSFFGEGGYGYVNGIRAPRYQSTLEAWVNPADWRDESIAGQGDGGKLFITGGRFAYRHMGQTVYASVGPNPGHWSQVVGVWDGVTISIYIDGTLRGSVESTERPSSSSTFYVGYGEDAPWFKGAIDEVAYYDTALTPARIYQHFIADPPPAELESVEGEIAAGGEQSQSGAQSPAADPGTPSAASTGSTPAATGSKPAVCAKKKGKARKACLKRSRRARRHR